jgi:hypothetical protein
MVFVFFKKIVNYCRKYGYTYTRQTNGTRERCTHPRRGNRDREGLAPLRPDGAALDVDLAEHRGGADRLRKRNGTFVSDRVAVEPQHLHGAIDNERAPERDAALARDRALREVNFLDKHVGHERVRELHRGTAVQRIGRKRHGFQ